GGGDPSLVMAPEPEQAAAVTFLLSSPQIQTRIANEKYLRTHKEVELLISGFFSRLPPCLFPLGLDNFLFSILIPEYFTDPRLPNKIHMQLIKEKKAA
uniref:Uncharacterized protein n=1 Tax=Panthera tigris altaica TaxID=74533 RepID=A0A8C9K6V5_PANTA